MLEDGAYRRLLDRYYGTETGIPASQAHRIARARTREEKVAVDAVLEEFFFLVDGVWKNNRAEQEIKKFSDKKPKADEKRESDKQRQQRARERRKALFEELSSLGVHMAWNTSTDELHAALDRAKSQPNHCAVTPPVTRDNTSTQTPDTSHQTPEVNLKSEQVDGKGSVRAPEPSSAAQVCIGLKAMGYSDTSPHDFELTALLQNGMSPGEILAVGEEFKGQGKRFRYLLATAKGRRLDAANIKPLPDKSTGALTKAGKATAEAAARWLNAEGEIA